MLDVHHVNSASPRPGSHGLAIHPTHDPAARVFLLQSPDELFHRRIARKRRVSQALRERGESKLDFLAVKLGIGRSYVGRCLSESHRDELRAEYVRGLGLEREVAEVDAWSYSEVLAYLGVAMGRAA